MEVNEREDDDCVYFVHLQVLVFTASAPLFRFDSFRSFHISSTFNRILIF